MNFRPIRISNTDDRGHHQRIGLQAPPHDYSQVATHSDTDTLPDPEAQPRSNAVTLVARATARSEDEPETTASSSRVPTTTSSNTPSTDTGQNERNDETSNDSSEDIETPLTDTRETVSDTHQRPLELSSEQEVPSRCTLIRRIAWSIILLKFFIKLLIILSME